MTQNDAGDDRTRTGRGMPSTNVETRPLTEGPPEAFRTMPKSLVAAFAALAAALVVMVVAIAILKAPG